MPQKVYGNSRHYGCRYGEAKRRHFIEAIVKAVDRRRKLAEKESLGERESCI